MLLSVWSATAAALSSRYEWALSQVGTCPGMTLDVARTLNSIKLPIAADNLSDIFVEVPATWLSSVSIKLRLLLRVCVSNRFSTVRVWCLH